MHERGAVLSRAHFSRASPGEREWIEEIGGQGHSLGAELPDRETRTANVSGDFNADQTETSEHFPNAARCGKPKQLLEGVY